MRRVQTTLGDVSRTDERRREPEPWATTKNSPFGSGAAVRRRRRALELTLAVVAERSGLSVPFLSQIENERARPSRSSLEKVADALRTTAVELLAAADPACSVDVVHAEGRAGARERPYAVTAVDAPFPGARSPPAARPSSPATMTRAVNSSTATTS